MYSKVKVFGHAIHPMLVSFPITFYTITFFTFIAYQSNGDPFWYQVGYLSNIAGVVMALLAAIPGIVDWATGIPRGTDAKKRGMIHGGFNTLALLLFSVNLLVLRGTLYSPLEDVSTSILLTGLGFIATMIAGYHGFSLMTLNKVGVDLDPEQERIEMSHEGHGHGHVRPLHR